MEIKVTNAGEAEATLNMEGIASEIINSATIQVEDDEYFTSLDLLKNELLLS